MRFPQWLMTFCGALAGMALALHLCPAEEKPALKAVTEKIVIPKSTVEFALVQLPAGRIAIKDKDGKERTVEIKPIWFGRTEVTWDEYDVFWLALDLSEQEQARIRSQPSGPLRDRPKMPYEPPDRGWGHEGFPACGVPIRWAKSYCEWLSKRTGHKYRLPTEAEWEYACRAGGAATKLEKAQLEKAAWYAANSDDQTHHVGKKEPNGFGLSDMLGNVAEWVIRADGSAVVAGGSFKDEAADVHAGAREEYDKNWQRSDPKEPKDGSWYTDGAHVGFRVVMEE